MKRTKKIIIGLLVLGVLSLVFGCTSKSSEIKVNNKENNDIKKEFKSKKLRVSDIESSEFQIIDIRSTEEYLGWKNKKGNSGHILGAIDFPIDWLTYEKNIDNIKIELDRRGIDIKNKAVIYSNNSISLEEYVKYKKIGFEDLFILEGGFNEYIKSDGKVEKLPGYKQYVSPKWVQELINGKSPESYENNQYKIVEITLSSETDLYSNGHIPGAININADSLNHIVGSRKLVEYDLIPMEKQLTFWDIPRDKTIKEVLEKSGITHDTTVILYASEKATTAANRAAFVMEYAGVKDIRLLNGGKVLWKLENRPLEDGKVQTSKVDFGVKVPQNPEINFEYEKELELIKDPNAVIASVRSWDEYLGKKSGYTYIGEAGDIANSRFAYAGSNPYAMEDYRNLDNTLFNYKIIANRWKRWGITPDKTISFHCGTGWRASETFYIAKALDWTDIGVYVGGWYEWTKRENSPYKEKGLPKDAPEEKPEEFFYKK